MAMRILWKMAMAVFHTTAAGFEVVVLFFVAASAPAGRTHCRSDKGRLEVDVTFAGRRPSALSSAFVATRADPPKRPAAQ
jgi:hypothetical protein